MSSLFLKHSVASRARKDVGKLRLVRLMRIAFGKNQGLDYYTAEKKCGA
jgi:hypothetical protein